MINYKRPLWMIAKMDKNKPKKKKQGTSNMKLQKTLMDYIDYGLYYYVIAGYPA